MPRQVDYEDRRRRIAEAVCTLIARSGMEAVSLRDVAAQAGVSMGAVQRCFRTKEDMLLFALEHISQHVSERANQRIASASTPQAAAFVAHAPVSEKLAAVLHDTYAKLHDLIAWLIRYGQDTREFPQILDPDREAHMLLALADGLTVHVLAGHHSPATALATLQRHIGHLLEDASDYG